MIRLPLRLAAWVLAIGCGAFVRAEQVPLSTQQAPFRSHVEVVEVDVGVTRGGATVAGLTAANFVVTDNLVPQDVTAVLLGAEPLRVMLVLDVSKSVSGSRLASLIKATNGMVAALGFKDQASLITFSHRVVLQVPMGQQFADINRAMAALIGTGATALRDAVYLGLANASDDRSRALLLVFSDGFDTASFVTREAVIESARHSNAVVHIVQLQTDRFLGELAQATGGRTWSARSDRQLEELFSQVLDEMRARYRLTYSPAERQKPGWHQIKVSLKGVRGDVVARQGYFVQ